jgi:hypothetical protein
MRLSVDGKSRYDLEKDAVEICDEMAAKPRESV